MQYLNLKFSGAKPYRDRTALRTVWQPGDVKAIPEPAARILRKFAEFAVVGGEAKPDHAAILVAQAKQEEEGSQIESMLLTIETWDKGQLEAYAKQYQVDLDKRRAINVLRQEVATLIEQYGVM